MTSMLDQLKARMKKNQDSKLTKEQPKQPEKPLGKILDFFLDRQASRLGIFYSLYNRNQPLEEPKPIIEPLKEDVMYV